MAVGVETSSRYLVAKATGSLSQADRLSWQYLDARSGKWGVFCWDSESGVGEGGRGHLGREDAGDIHQVDHSRYRR